MDLVFGLALAGCSGDEDSDRTQAADVELIDQDGDGQPDGVDLDGDGEPDVGFDLSCKNPLIDQDGDGRFDAIDFDCEGDAEVAWCEEPLIDDDGDGIPEAIDLDCDGESDIDIELPDLGWLPRPLDFVSRAAPAQRAGRPRSGRFGHALSFSATPVRGAGGS